MGVRIRIPAVEIAHHGNPLRIGRPHREMRAAAAVELHDVRAKLLEQPHVSAFVEQMQVEGSQ